MCGGLVEMFGADSLLSIMLLALLVIDLSRCVCGAEENGCELVGKVAGSCGEGGNLCEFGEGGG